MSRAKQTFFAICFFYLFCTLSVFAEMTLEDILPSETVERLRSEGKIQELLFKDDEIVLKYAPKTVLTEKLKNDWDRETRGNPTFSSESLYLMKKTDKTEQKESVDRISLIIRSVSQMKGIQYYSNSRRKMFELYSDAYTVNDLTNRVRIADNTDYKADGLHLYMYQHDASFGGCIYDMYYSQRQDEVSFTSINTDPLYYMIFKCVKEDNIMMSLNFIDLDDSVLIYALVQAKYIDFPGFEAHVKKSFDARTEAIFKWFVELYNDKEFLK